MYYNDVQKEPQVFLSLSDKKHEFEMFFSIVSVTLKLDDGVCEYT